MKKKFNILAVSVVIIGLTAGLFGMVVFSKAAPADKNQNSYKEAPKPIHATNIKIAKKIPASLVVGEAKGRPNTPPGKDKEDDFSDRAATGVLGTEITGDKYAVVIGICDYPETSNDICDSDGDSYNMVTALIENYGYLPGNISWFRDMGGSINVGGVEMSYKVPSYDNIYNAVMGIKNNNKINANDEVVFFFSGHGGLLRDDGGNPIDQYPYDEADKKDELIVCHNGDELVGILDDTLFGWFDNFVTDRIVFIFDTCLAGGMNDVAGDGRVLIMSSKETQSSYVYSYGEFGEGMFSRHFVHEGMLDGLADGYNQISYIDSVVAVEEAFDYAKENFPRYLKFRQNPVISDDDSDNDLLL